jgi:hypothetical protein
VIPSKWQALLLYGVLFGALILFPRGIPSWRVRRLNAPEPGIEPVTEIGS